MKRLLILVVVIVGLGVVSLVLLSSDGMSLRDGESVKVQLGTAAVQAVVNATDESKAKGLGDTPSLPEDRGELFLFEPSSYPVFWMKDVAYPIDIIWMQGETVTQITPSVPGMVPGTPDQQLPRYSPNAPVDKVLEVTGGWAAKHDVKAGSTVKINP